MCNIPSVIELWQRKQMDPKQIVLLIIFKNITIVDHDLQLRRVAKVIAEDIRMKAMNCKHEGPPKRFVDRSCTDPKAILLVIDIKDEDNDGNLKAKKKKKLKRDTCINWFDKNLWP